MSISKKARAGIVAGAAIAAVSLAGIGVAASANAADSTTPSTTSSASAKPAHTPEVELTGATADSVKAAVLAKYPGATVTKMETDTDNGGTYEAYITKADGTKAKVLLDSSFTVTKELAGKGPKGDKGAAGTHAKSDGTGKGKGRHGGGHQGHRGAATPSASATPAA